MPHSTRAIRVLIPLFLLFLTSTAARAADSTRIVRVDDLSHSFASPPASARPWVYWFWLNGNISKEGITADLEAMKRVGIGGVLIMEVDQGTPKGPAPFGGPLWRELFKHVCSEAHRLGLEVNMNNDAGWCGSGGPWVTPALSMQKVVWTETRIEGPRHIEQDLAQPETVAGYYEDIATLAFPTPADDTYRIDDISGKAAFNRSDLPPPPATVETLPGGKVIPANSLVDLTPHVKNGKLVWDVPAGTWTVIRFGHTSKGIENHPAPEAGLGLESDKLSASATDAYFAGLMGKLIADNPGFAGSSLAATHIDSWETGSQNWTPLMRDDFRRLRGYDPLPYLPVLTGRVVGSLDLSERFLWDFRQTASDLLNENYAARMRELAQQHGMRLSIEAYGDCLTDDMAYGGRADEPMGEFWAWPYGSSNSSVTEMSSAAHTYGKRILGAESFTSDADEKWQSHPASIKVEGDWALCEGVNRFVFHRYAMQPWTDVKSADHPQLARKPGMSMGPWGLHYERTQTWWEQSKPWHTYLARCQYLLRQGHFSADIAYLEPEGSPRQFSPPIPRPGSLPDRPAYNFDGCTPEVVMTRMKARGGWIVLPDGMEYRLLALPDSQSMTLPLLTAVEKLVADGATVVGPPPSRTPGLAGYPASDARIKEIAARLWGDCDGKTIFEHKYGKGRVVWGRTPEQVLAGDGVPGDFTAGKYSPFRYIHRRLDDGGDLYFVANKQNFAQQALCSFRAASKSPELWWPETGRTEPLATYHVAGGVTQVPLRLEAAQSVFVVFRPHGPAFDPVVSATRDGKSILASNAPVPVTIKSAIYGVPGDSARTRDVRAKLQALVDGGALSFTVAQMAEGDDPAFGIVKTLKVEYVLGGKQYFATGQDPDTINLAQGEDSMPTASVTRAPDGRLVLDAWKPGRYQVKTASGKTFDRAVPGVPAALAVDAPWSVSFPPNAGAPAQVTLDKLISWSDDPDPGVQHFSGTATYDTVVTVPKDLPAPGRRIFLDLGDVQVIARATLNGRDLGILWKPPYRVDVTDCVKPGQNDLRVQVTNLWIDRMIGDEQLPEDSDRNGDGTLKAWPQWLEDGKPSPTGRYTFTSWRLWHKDSPLQPSGLIGPVTLVPEERTVLDMSK